MGAIKKGCVFFTGLSLGGTQDNEGDRNNNNNNNTNCGGTRISARNPRILFLFLVSVGGAERKMLNNNKEIIIMWKKRASSSLFRRGRSSRRGLGLCTYR